MYTCIFFFFEGMLPLLVALLGATGAYVFLRYYWPVYMLDWIYIRSRKRVSSAIFNAVAANKQLIDIFEDKVSEHPLKTFLIFEEKTYSYGEIDKLANQAARTALEVGLRPGDVVAVLLYNEPAIVWTYLGKIFHFEVSPHAMVGPLNILFAVNNSLTRILEYGI